MNEDLRKWFKEKWVDISRKKKGGGHPPCGASADKGVRAKDSSKKYPKCVPANKAKNMSKKQKKSAVTRKRRAPNEPGSPDFVKTDVKKESWENWKPRREEVYSNGVPSNNAPENPEPMGGAEAFEKSRKRVLADLREMIQYLVKEAFNEEERKTPKIGRGVQPPAPSAVNGNVRAIKARLERLFSDTDFPIRDLITIAETFHDILKAGIDDQFVDFLQNMPDKIISAFNRAVESIPEGSENEWVKSVVGKMSQSIEWNLEQPERTQMGLTGTPLASTDFANAVHSYLDMVNTHISDPAQRQRISNWIRQVRFDRDIPEADKERMILGYIRSELNPGGPSRRLNERIQMFIIKTVLQERKLYG